MSADLEAEAPVFLGHWSPSSEGLWPDAWHEARLNGIGGSEISAVMGLNPWDSPFSLWHRKLGRISAVEMNDAMEWGTRLEPVILRKFLDLHPEFVGEHVGTWRHGERWWQIANPDLALIHRDRSGRVELVDAKFSRYGDGYGKEGTDEVPVHVRCQALWYLDVFGLERCHIAVLVGGMDYAEYVVQHSEHECRILRDKAATFMQTLADGERPDIDGHSETYQAVRELNPDIDDRIIDITEDMARLFCVTRAELAEAEKAHSFAKSTLLDHMGEAKTAKWDGVKIAGRQTRGNLPPWLVAGRKLPDFTETKDEAA